MKTALTGRYRWVVLGVLWLTLLVSYFDRVALGSALPFLSKEIGLSPAVAGVVSGALFLSYTIVQVPAGAWTDRFGQRRVIAAAIAWWTVFSVLTGVVAGSLAALLVVRLLMGAGEGFHAPPLWRALSNWFEPGRRSLPLALMLTALTLGPALAPSIAFPLIATWGWRSVFYATLVPGVLCVVLVLAVMRDAPGRRNLVTRPAPEAARRPRRWWVPHIWLTFGAFFCFGFVLYGLMNWLPTYLLTYRGLTLLRAGVFSTVPFLAGTVGMLLGAYVCQRWFNRSRRGFVAVTYLLTAVTVAATAAAPDATTSAVFLTASGFFLYAGLGPFWSVPMDVVRPGEVGTWLGFINMGTQLAGLLGPVAIGWIIQAGGSFTLVFAVMVAAMVVGAACLALARPKRVAEDSPAELARTRS
ncbi:MFS transporter [Amycolatopsis australiensis]|uniref:Sugar phosphate permease n=1 Tax=Amycolatopsis australiensis TaxID=546364 RepID=A0A1K1R6Z6_9PSEU|nr:MFS transporter [Amycolatopsis australiensis]SFW67398.1 Sugar phosphate permease [Amycolatopsis australiensis]